MKNTKNANKVIAAICIMFSLALTVTLCQNPKVNRFINGVVKSNFAVSQNTQNEEDITIDNFSIPINDINDLIYDNITGIVYFGRDSCPFCLKFNEILKTNIDITELNIYKFDTDKWRNHEKYQTILDKYHIENIPALIKINSNYSVEIYKPNENATDKEVVDSLNHFLFDN